MFAFKLVIYLNLLLNVVARKKYNESKFINENNPIIDPSELVLSSSDTEGSFYCHSKVEINKQRNKLVAYIEKTNSSSPTFQLKTEQINSTTIRIRIMPNGYIGINRIRCHWDDDVMNSQTAALIIGGKPGIIQLKEQCRAYDRLYVECVFLAPIISQAFRNGFPKMYFFKELTYETLSYHDPPVLMNITNQNELVFYFQPRNKNLIPKKIPMLVNITLIRFKSLEYQFNIEPLHTTRVDFRVQPVSNKRLDVYINHNNTNTINKRLCSGHVSQISNKPVFTAVQDIIPTSKHKISINHLRSSSEYLICLRCYYERNDQSFKEIICNSSKTALEKFSTWKILLLTSIVVAIISGISCLIVQCGKQHPPPSPSPSDPTDNQTTVPLVYRNNTNLLTHPRSPSSSQSTINSTSTEGTEQIYLPRKDIIKETICGKRIWPDTYILSCDSNILST